MTRPNLYVDLDSTLIHPVGEEGDLVYVKVRPGIEWFFRHLAQIGKVNILTHGVREHAQRALHLLPMQYINLVVAREDMQPIANALEYGQKPRPILPPGPIFDDYPWGSWLAKLKSATVGIKEPRFWIQVERFDFDSPDRGGLKKAFGEFVRRFA
jgi:hypothetical protein